MYVSCIACRAALRYHARQRGQAGKRSRNANDDFAEALGEHADRGLIAR
jgi:hypothetical protein